MQTKDILSSTQDNVNHKTTPIIAELVEASKPQPLFSRWKKRTLEDAYRERPPIEYIVDGILRAGSLTIGYGSPGCMKSLLLADLAVCVASGARWLEPLPTSGGKSPSFATKKYPVLWVDYDNGTRTTDERFDAFGKARLLPANAPLTYYSMTDPWLRADDDALMMEFAEGAKLEGYKLIIIDNLGNISGDADENTADMVQVMGNLRKVAEVTNAAVIVIHHQKKGTTEGRSGDMIRGHSSIEAALDLALNFCRNEQDSTVTIKPTKVRGASLSTNVCAEFTYTHKPGTKELEEARFWGASPTPTSEKDQKLILIDSSIKIVLNRYKGKNDMPNQTDLAAAVSGYIENETNSKSPKSTAIKDRIGALVASGEVIEAKGATRNAKKYSLPQQ